MTAKKQAASGDAASTVITGDAAGDGDRYDSSAGSTVPPPDGQRVTPSAAAFPLRQHTTPESGIAAGQAAPKTIYERTVNDDGQAVSEITYDEPERGRVLVFAGDVVTPGVALRLHELGVDGSVNPQVGNDLTAEAREAQAARSGS